MDELLPDEFDVVIIGTGLPESVLSGALSRIGQKVLHIDQEEYYGSRWASFNIKGLDDLMKCSDKSNLKKDMDIDKLLNDDEAFQSISPRSCMTHSESHCYLSSDIICNGNVEELKQSVKDSCNESVDQVQTDATSSITGNLKSDECNEIEDANAAAQEAEEKESSKSFDDPTNKQEQILDHSSNQEIILSDNTATQKGEDKESKSLDDPTNKQEQVPDHSSDKEIGLSCTSTADEAVLEGIATTNNSLTKPKISAREEFYNCWRSYNIDLTSKIMFSRGLLVELLIQSNVSRYLEFRNVSRLLALTKGKLQPVPCTRAEVFKSKLVSVVQKRFLMRVLTTCANIDQHPEIVEEFRDKTFVDFLASNKLTDDVQHFVIHSIAMVSGDALAADGIRAAKKFLSSLGRYGNSAFLFPTYGVGELPQAFSRLSAVFGGTFCLRRFAVGFIVDKQTGRCKAIVDSTGQRISCQWLVVDESNAPDLAQKDFENCTSRAVYVTDRSLQKSTSEQMSLISVPSTETNRSLRLVECGPATYVCPSNHYLIHAVTVSPSATAVAPSTVFKPVEDALFECSEQDAGDCDESSSNKEGVNPGEESKPKLLWRAYFNVLEKGFEPSKLPANVFVMNGPGNELGFDSVMQEARTIFEVICPNEEFLPRAPEPDEIVFNDEGYNTEKNGSHSSEERIHEDEENAEKDAASNEEPGSEKESDGSANDNVMAPPADNTSQPSATDHVTDT